MFRRLISAWSGKSLLSEALDEFNSILEIAERLFDKVTDVLLGKIDASAAADLSSQDSRINDLERSIRSKIIEYLTFEPEGDRPAALILFSVVKDAERLGDFCKDIMGVTSHFPKDNSLGVYKEPFLQMEAQLEEMFSMARRAFLESDKNLAIRVVETRAVVKNECKDLLAKVMADKSLDSASAVSYAMVIYFFKRVGAHLFNIASSVLVPLSDLGHFKLM